MKFKHLIVVQAEGLAVVEINRPKVLNALNAVTIDELHELIDELTTDRTVRAIVLTGSGERSFIAGGDIEELAAMKPTRAQEVAKRGQMLADRLEGMGKPIVAAINGYALGAGCEIAMACTLRIAAETSKIGLPEINLGLIPGYGGTQRLPRLVGVGRALEMLLTGEQIDAKEAWRIGLVNRVVPPSRLMEEAKALAAVLAAKAPLASRYILEAVRGGLKLSLPDGCDLEAALFGLVSATEDMREGTQAFLEKRRPTFKGV